MGWALESTTMKNFIVDTQCVTYQRVQDCIETSICLKTFGRRWLLSPDLVRWPEKAEAVPPTSAVSVVLPAPRHALMARGKRTGAILATVLFDEGPNPGEELSIQAPPLLGTLGYPAQTSFSTISPSSLEYEPPSCQQHLY